MKWPLILILSTLSSLSFAQDMASLEDKGDAYVETSDGGTRYVGKCSTHEAYYKFYFKTSKVIQSFIDSDDLTETKLESIIAKLDPEVVEMIKKTNSLSDLSDVDDLTIDILSHEIYRDLRLIRFTLGTDQTIFNKTSTGHELISQSLNGELKFCDKKVWLGKR